MSSCTSFSDATLDQRAPTDTADSDSTGGDVLDTGGATDVPSDANQDGDATPLDAGNTRNDCGGADALRWNGEEATIGGDCGPCGDGVIVCNGPSAVRCARATSLNACGGCGELPGMPGDACGPCDRGAWQCNGEGGAVCEGAVGRNACGGCESLTGAPGIACEVDGALGTFVCNDLDDLTCELGERNSCGGTGPLQLEGEDAALGDTCGDCGDGVLVCDGPDRLRCDGASDRNACGGCGELRADEGDECGPCGERWTCAEGGGLACDLIPLNVCGGCRELTSEPGTRCSGGVRVCSSTEGVVCVAEGAEVNDCGGEGGLDGLPGGPCGLCDSGVWECDGINAVTCEGALRDRNACGGCASLTAPPGTGCGTCGSGEWTCAEDGELVVCEGDVGDAARNACGGCGALTGTPGDSCGSCAELRCRGARLACVAVTDDPSCGGGGAECDELACDELERECVPATDDAEARCGDCLSGFVEEEGGCVEAPAECGDGIVTADEECDDGDDNSDREPDACRTDCTIARCGDGVLDGDETCDGDDLGGATCVALGFDGGTLSCSDDCDELIRDRCVAECPPDDPDRDGDGVVDVCDPCPDDPEDDRDGDGACDSDDPCPLDPDDDRDGDGVCDSDDPCPDDSPDDTDEDGVCDSEDICPGGVDSRDADGDRTPDHCDRCPGSDDRLDADGDGVPNGCDLCAGADDALDRDEDGTPDDCDACPDDATDDSDGDGVCDSDDICADGDDTMDRDEDGVPDACDACPDDSTGDTDGDGVCDSEDVCPDGDDTVDSDRDGLPDACDPCPEDNPNDSDGDGICDSDDVCAAGDDRLDTDGDGVADACDPCPLDDPDDTDEDGVCDTDDICAGGDDTVDTDDDGLPDACDACPEDDPNDSDGDGICDSDDICAAGDDRLDADADGVPDACDPCPLDNPDDSDDDGVCDSDDVCSGSDDTIDGDGDGVPDACDPCPADNPDDANDNGVCDSDEFCGDEIVSGDEECDEGTSNSDTEPDACREDCTLPTCGDGTVDTDEECDDGGRVAEDGCSPTCMEELCGDGVVQTGLGEECDDGNEIDGDGCSPTCMEEFCGDGVLQLGTGEGCDDGNTIDGDGCDGRCQVEGPEGFAFIPAGTFTMGSPEDEMGRTSSNEAQHEIVITRPFLLQRTEVTQGQWAAVMGGTRPALFGECGDDCPVERVNWWDAVAYLNTLSRRNGLPECYVMSGCTGEPGTGCTAPVDDPVCPGTECATVTFVGLDCRGYRLPTEAEWEYAARAGTTTATYSGDLVLDAEFDSPTLNPIAWYSGNSGVSYSDAWDCSTWPDRAIDADRCGTHPVATKEPNPWGVYDMLGNVQEWTWDWASSDTSDATDPLGPGTGSVRRTRSCSWATSPLGCRAADRSSSTPEFRHYQVGFRAARTFATESERARFDLTFRGIAFEPHEGQSLWVSVIEQSSGDVIVSDETTVSDGRFSFLWEDILLDGDSYYVDYAADLNENGFCEAPPTDHGWRVELETVFESQTIEQRHDTDFYPEVCASLAE